MAKTIKQIADELGMSKNTFKKLKDIYQKSNTPHSISVK